MAEQQRRRAGLLAPGRLVGTRLGETEGPCPFVECHRSSGSRSRRLPGPQHGAKPCSSRPPPAAGAPADAAGRDTRRLAGQLGDNGPAVPMLQEAYREGGALPRVTEPGGGWREAARKCPEQRDPVMRELQCGPCTGAESNPLWSSCSSHHNLLCKPPRKLRRLGKSAAGPGSCTQTGNHI